MPRLPSRPTASPSPFGTSAARPRRWRPAPSGPDGPQPSTSSRPTTRPSRRPRSAAASPACAGCPGLACFVMERTLDAIAAELDLDRAEVRRRSLIRPDEFPYDVGLAWQDGNAVVYDSGDYPLLLERALHALGPRPARDHVGMGLAMYVEGTGVGPYEGAHVQVLVSGKVVAATGIPSQGQAHATVWAQIVADELGVDVADVEVTSGDTRRFPWGVGTFASRGAVTAGNAMHVAARVVAGKARHLAAEHLDVNPDGRELV